MQPRDRQLPVHWSETVLKKEMIGRSLLNITFCLNTTNEPNDHREFYCVVHATVQNGRTSIDRFYSNT